MNLCDAVADKSLLQTTEFVEVLHARAVKLAAVVDGLEDQHEWRDVQETDEEREPEDFARSVSFAKVIHRQRGMRVLCCGVEASATLEDDVCKQDEHVEAVEKGLDAKV